MRKYILFQRDLYYPVGGLNDIVDSFSTIGEAKNKAEEDLKDFNEIVDRDTWKVILERELFGSWE